MRVVHKAAFALVFLTCGVDGVSDRCYLEREVCFRGEVASLNISHVKSFERCCDLCIGSGNRCAAWTMDYARSVCHIFSSMPVGHKKDDRCDAGSPSSPAPGPAPSPPGPTPPGPAPAPSSIKVQPLPSSLSAYRKYFTKYVPVFGIPILAESGMPDWMVEHAGHIMAQYLDYTADGRVDNEDVLASMKERKAVLVMFVDPDSKASQKAMDAVGEGGQDLDQPDIPSWAPRPPNASVHRARVIYGSHIPRCSDAHRRFHHGAVQHCLGAPLANDFDASLEEILHLITDNGYAAVYPSVFGTSKKTWYSQIAATMNDMVGDCGWAFNHTSKYPKCTGKFHYSDETCDYQCLVTEYTMWSLTSILGGQDGSHNDALKGRCKDVAREWEMCTKQLVAAEDPRAFAIFDVDGANQYKVPNKLPDGIYRPASPPAAEAMDLDAAYSGATHLDLGRHEPLVQLTAGPDGSPRSGRKWCNSCARVSDVVTNAATGKSCAAACHAAAAASGAGALVLGTVCGELCGMVEHGICKDSRLDCAEKLCQEIGLCPKRTPPALFVV